MIAVSVDREQPVQQIPFKVHGEACVWVSDTKNRKTNRKVSGGNFCRGASLGVEHFPSSMTSNGPRSSRKKIQ
jgi:hypothetical protein